MKVRNGGGKEIPLIQGKEQQLCFAGAVVKRYPTPKARAGGRVARRSIPRSGGCAGAGGPREAIPC